MYHTIRASEIKPGLVISLTSKQYLVLRVLDLGNKNSVSFIAKPLENQYPRPFILESDYPLFSSGHVKYKHSHFFHQQQR